jgi:hypothetical protein
MTRRKPDVEMSWDDMTDIAKIARLRREAENFRAVKSEWDMAEELADMCDAEADRIEAGDVIDGDEKESPEQLLAEAEVARDVVDLLKRYDAGTLGELIERYSKSDSDQP